MNLKDKWVFVKVMTKWESLQLGYVARLKGDKAQVWIVENEYRNKHWDFSERSLENEKPTKLWVKRWFPLSEIDRHYNHPAKVQPAVTPSLRLFTENLPSIYKVRGDGDVEYGNGGWTRLIYPIWVCDHLSIEEEERLQLVTVLHALNEERTDFQKDTPVEDIIDPDLGPLPVERWLQGDMQSDKGSELDSKDDVEGPSEAVSRSSYSWIPSEFLVRADGTVKILTRIHGLPPEVQNKELYLCIRNVFSKMVPMFGKLNLINEKSDTMLQVVVKAQSCNLKPGMTYSGRWHTEGKTENIVAAGVYCCNADQRLKGGNVKFRPAVTPKCYGISKDCEVVVEEGTAVVFANTIPHRFRKISNTSTITERRRTLLNFFIVNPDHKIKSTRNLPSSQMVTKLLSAFVTQKLNNHLPREIITQIMSYIPGYWSSMSSMKAFRKRARQGMQAGESGWGEILYDGCSIEEFVENFSSWDSWRKQETDSD